MGRRNLTLASFAPRAIAGSDDFYLDGIRFKVAVGPNQGAMATDEEGIVLAKPLPFVVEEIEALSDLRVQQLLEFGVQRGGSAILWSLVWRLRRYVGIDIADLNLNFPRAVRDHPRYSAVTLIGRTSQADAARVTEVINREFDGPLDLVVDDASHLFALSQRSFEIAFPRIRPGGAYLLEDWAWAHRPGPWNNPSHAWYGSPSLANLVFRFVLLAATRPQLVARVIVRQRFVVVIRGPEPSHDVLNLDGAIGGPRPVPPPI